MLIIIFLMLGLIALASFFMALQYKIKNQKILQNIKKIEELQKKKLKYKNLLLLLEKGKLFLLLFVFFVISLFKKVFKKIFKKIRIILIIPVLICAAGNEKNTPHLQQKDQEINEKNTLLKNEKIHEKLKKCQKLLKETLIENQSLIQEIENSLIHSNLFLKNQNLKAFAFHIGIPMLSSPLFSPLFSLSYSFKNFPLLIGIGFYQNQIFLETGFRWGF